MIRPDKIPGENPKPLGTRPPPPPAPPVKRMIEEQPPDQPFQRGLLLMYPIGEISGHQVYAATRDSTDANILSAILGCMKDLRERYRWIPLDERLPEWAVPVIVATTTRIISEAYWDGQVWRWENDTPVNSECVDGEVAYWMPMPPHPVTPEEFEKMTAQRHP